MVTVETLIARLRIVYPNVEIKEELTVRGVPSYSVAEAAGIEFKARSIGDGIYKRSYSGKVTFPWCGQVWEAIGTSDRSGGANMVPYPASIEFTSLSI